MCQGSLRGQGKVCLLLDPLLLTWNSRFHLCLGGFLIVKIYLFAFLFPPGDKSRSRCSSNLAKKVAMIWLLTFQHLSRRCYPSPCCCPPSPYSPVLSALSACCQSTLAWWGWWGENLWEGRCVRRIDRFRFKLDGWRIDILRNMYVVVKVHPSLFWEGGGIYVKW